jgi:hypothetical protein
MGANATLDNNQAVHQRARFNTTFGRGLGSANIERINRLFPKSVTIPENRKNENADRSNLFDDVGDEKSIERAYRRVVESESIKGNGFETEDAAVNLNYGGTPEVVDNSYTVANDQTTIDNSGKETWAMYPDIRSRNIADPETASNVNPNNGFVVERSEQFGTTASEDRSKYENKPGDGSSNFSPTLGMYFRNSRTQEQG